MIHFNSLPTASSDIGVVAGIAGGAGVMFIIAAIVVAIIYVNVNKRLKVINQNIKCTSPTKSGTVSNVVSAKIEDKYQNVPSPQTQVWSESSYELNGISPYSNTHNYDSLDTNMPAPLRHATVERKPTLSKPAFPQRMSTGDQEI